MIDQVLEAVQGAVSSPWLYAALFVFACVDAFFPAVPSESLVITAGVYAASGEPALAGVVACAAAGAFAGDHVAFWAGRSSRGRALGWAARMLERRGGLVLVVARYVPGGRTAVTVAMGAVGYPARAFAGFAAVAAVSWGCYAALVGYVGGRAFEEDPARGLLVGFGLAAGITALVEAARFVRSRRAAPPPRAVSGRSGDTSGDEAGDTSGDEAGDEAGDGPGDGVDAAAGVRGR